jgi:hypothetical protein
MLARAGLIARGVIYILIGWVAILVALGKSGREADQRGALQLLAKQPFGQFLLWVLGIGFAAYALWRLSEAAFGVSGEGPGAGPRLKSLLRAIIYAFLAFTTFQVIGGGRGSQSGKQSDWTAQVMRHAGGRIAIGILGAIVVIAGLMLVVEGWRRKFLKHLNTGQMSARTRRNVERLGMVGAVARGLVFALAGALVIDAAVTYKPSKAGGLGTALSTLHNQPFGKVALFAVALGLMIFGVYGLCEAKWRRV